MTNSEPRRLFRGIAHGAAYALLALSLAWAFASRAAAHEADELAGALPHETAAALADGRPLVALVIQAEDCVNDLALLAAWSERASQDSARVVAVLVNASSAPVEAVEQLATASEVRFPVHRAEDSSLQRILRGLGYRQTPLAVLLDRHGRMRSVAPLRSPSGSPEVLLAAAALLARED